MDEKKETGKTLINGTIVSNRKIADSIYDMRILAEGMADVCKPGRFVGLYTGNGVNLLPRPISICDVYQEQSALRLVYQVVGEGTRIFSALPAQAPVRILGPLGNGFTIQEADQFALVGGGIGVPPLLFLCRALRASFPMSRITVFLGFRDAPILADDFKAFGADVHIATDSGSYGFHGNAVDLLKQTALSRSALYACGPKPMLRGLAAYAEQEGIPCQLSMEERMACGLGACVGCVIKIKNRERADGWEYRKVCKDGPVFHASEVIWDV